MTNNGTVYNTASAINPMITRLFHLLGVYVLGSVCFRAYLFKTCTVLKYLLGKEGVDFTEAAIFTNNIFYCTLSAEYPDLMVF